MQRCPFKPRSSRGPSLLSSGATPSSAQGIVGAPRCRNKHDYSDRSSTSRTVVLFRLARVKSSSFIVAAASIPVRTLPPEYPAKLLEADRPVPIQIRKVHQSPHVLLWTHNNPRTRRKPRATQRTKRRHRLTLKKRQEGVTGGIERHVQLRGSLLLEPSLIRALLGHRRIHYMDKQFINLCMVQLVIKNNTPKSVFSCLDSTSCPAHSQTLSKCREQKTKECNVV